MLAAVLAQIPQVRDDLSIAVYAAPAQLFDQPQEPLVALVPGGKWLGYARRSNRSDARASSDTTATGNVASSRA